MSFLLLADILPQKAKDVISKLWFVPAAGWFLYNIVIMIVFINSYKPLDLAINAFMTAVYAAAHLFVGLWLKRPYKTN